MIIDVTPKMTSNTSPAPYKVTRNSAWDTSYEAWKAFNKYHKTAYPYDIWETATGVTSGWIQLDFNVKTKINMFTLRSWSGTTNSSPKNIELKGSNDNVNFNTIFSKSNLSWSIDENKTFTLSKNENYRYYRLNITGIINTSNYNRIVISELCYYYDDMLFYDPSPIIKDIVYNQVKPVLDLATAKFTIET